ncbi:hypothetical protein Hanom_Chr11g01053351 [Helianthus anomalus]
MVPVVVLCNAFSPQPTNLKVLACSCYGPNSLQSVNHKDHPCTFDKSWEQKTSQSANHRDHPCTFEKLGTKSKILVNHRDHRCTFDNKILVYELKQAEQVKLGPGLVY